MLYLFACLKDAAVSALKNGGSRLWLRSTDAISYYLVWERDPWPEVWAAEEHCPAGGLAGWSPHGRRYSQPQCCPQDWFPHQERRAESRQVQGRAALRAIVSKFGRFLHKQYVHLGAVCVFRYCKFDFIGILIDVKLYIQYSMYRYSSWKYILIIYKLSAKNLHNCKRYIWQGCTGCQVIEKVEYPPKQKSSRAKKQ